MMKGKEGNFVTLKIWYNGDFLKNGDSLKYVGKSYRTVVVDADEFCWFTLVEEAEKCGKYLRNVDFLFYKIPDCSFESGLKMVVDDKEARLMCEIGLQKTVVECYVVFAVDVGHLLQLLEGSSVCDDRAKKVSKLTPRRKIMATKKVSPKPCKRATFDQGPPHSPNTLQTLKASCGSSPRLTNTKHIPEQIEPYLPLSNEAPQNAIDISHYLQCPYDFNEITLSKSFDDYEINADLTVHKSGEEISEEDDDPGYIPEVENDNSGDEELSDFDLVSEEELFDGEVEENLIEKFDVNSDAEFDEEQQQASVKLKEWNANIIKIAHQLQLQASSGLLPGQQSQLPSQEANLQLAIVDGQASDYDNSGDEIHTPGESEDDSRPGNRRRSNVVVVDETTNFAKLKWCVGIKFPNRAVFRDCVTRYAVAQGRDLKFDVSDKRRGQRLRVRCIEGCPFKLYGSWDKKSESFVIKSVDPSHTCQRTMEPNRQMKSTWVAKQLLEVFKSRPHWPASEIIDTVRKAYKVIIKKDFAYKVKYAAHKLLHGSMKEHYSKVGSYMAALRETNPSNVITLFTNPSTTASPLVFQRLFVCLDALKQGWLIGCRKLLCVDSCFLKTFLGGQLISVIGRDANEQMFPLAWDVVEGENNGSYEWFFQELKKCVGEKDGDGWTFISDEHPSIITMVKKEFPKAEHRHCARHIFANWHKTYRGDEMKLMFWNCAKAYNSADFNDAIAVMREANHAAAEAFIACQPHLFCRAFIGTQTTNDVIVNNMAETFNAYIINARTKHLLYMLEDIRVAVMQRLVKKRNEMEKRTGLLCPRAQELLDDEKAEAANCVVYPSSTTTFEVEHGLEKLIVDIEARTCTRKKWNLTGIPCCHGLAAIFHKCVKAEEYVDDLYKRDTYLKIYAGSISACAGERHWPKVHLPLNPPPIKVGPGRPRKKRRKDPFEDPKKKGKLTKHGIQMSCSVCKSTTHNKRKCPDKDNAIPRPPPSKRSRGRPSLGGQSSNVFSEKKDLHHDVTAQPTRVGRGGRVIKDGRCNSGSGRRGSKSGGNVRTSKVPQGAGVIIDDQGYAFTNVLGSSHGPKSITVHDESPSTQASTCVASI